MNIMAFYTHRGVAAFWLQKVKVMVTRIKKNFLSVYFPQYNSRRILIRDLDTIVCCDLRTKVKEHGRRAT